MGGGEEGEVREEGILGEQFEGFETGRGVSNEVH